MIKSDTCPYCQGPYMLYIGCTAKCSSSLIAAKLICDAIKHDPREIGERKMIDFTKPVRMKDGTPVKVLCTNAPGKYPVVIRCDFPEAGKGYHYQLLTYTLQGCRNISDPQWHLENYEPESFVWFNIYKEKGKLVTSWERTSRKAADDLSRHDRVGCIKVKLEARFDT